MRSFLGNIVNFLCSNGTLKRRTIRIYDHKRALLNLFYTRIALRRSSKKH